MTHSRGAVALALLATVLFGALVATQSRINGDLGRELGDGYLAAFISFGSGFLIMIVVALVHPSTRRGVATIVREVRERRMPWWFTVGGTAGAIFVLAQGLTAAVLGVALFTVATVTGQTLSGMLVDRRGLGTMQPKPVTLFRLVGAILAVIAVVVAVSPKVEGGVEAWVLVLPLAAGLGLGWQQAVNGQLRQASTALTATFFNFLVGATVLGVILVVHALVSGLPAQLSASPWLYTGGAVGIIFVAGYAVAIRYTGVLLLGLAALAGQLMASLVFDLALPVPGSAVAPATIIGTAATFGAVAIAAIPPRGSRGASRG